MKIMFVTPYFGFSGMISDMLAGHLAKRGHDIAVVGYLRPSRRNLFSEEKRRLEEKNIHYYLAKAISISIPNYVTEFPFFLSFKQLVEEVQPDIIHINCLPFFTSYQAAEIAKKTRKKSILQVHGVIAERGLFFNTLQELYSFTFGNLTFHNVDKVVCLTNGDAERICRYGCPSKKIDIIPNGVDVSEFHPTSHEESGLLLWCGRFVQQKGLEYLIEALKCIEAKEKPITIKLMMTGDGPLLSKIYQLVKKNGLSSSVLFMGRVPRKDIPILMSKSSIYILPSLNEGMPYTLLEAMACGKTVIGTNISGIRDIITHGHNGILVPPRDPEALANAILTLSGDKNLRRTLGQNARELMTRRYSWDTITARMEKAYEETLAGARCKTGR